MTGLELVFITDPALSDKELESLQKNFKISLSESEGKLVHEFVWGRRRLAYEIEGNDFGIYHTWYFTGSGKTVDELQRQFGYSDNVLRHQIVKVEDVDTEAAFMQNLIPPKDERVEKESSEESSQPKQETEKAVLASSENEKSDKEEQVETEKKPESDEEEQVETEKKPESDEEESDSIAKEDDSESLEA